MVHLFLTIFINAVAFLAKHIMLIAVAYQHSPACALYSMVIDFVNDF